MVRSDQLSIVADVAFRPEYVGIAPERFLIVDWVQVYLHNCSLVKSGGALDHYTTSNLFNMK